MVKDKANVADIVAYFNDKNIPDDEITLIKLAEQVLDSPRSKDILQSQMLYNGDFNIKE